MSTGLSVLKIFPFTSLFLGKVIENKIRIWDFSVKGGESCSSLQVTFPVCKGRLTMFIWQRALGLGYDLKCFGTGNTLPSYIFIFTASNAKNWKGAVIRELALTFSSASHLTLQTSFPAQEMRDSMSSDSSPSWLWTAAAIRAQWLCNTGNKSWDVTWHFEKRKKENLLHKGRKLFSFLTTLSPSHLWEAETGTNRRESHDFCVVARLKLSLRSCWRNAFWVFYVIIVLKYHLRLPCAQGKLSWLTLIAAALFPPGAEFPGHRSLCSLFFSEPGCVLSWEGPRIYIC